MVYTRVSNTNKHPGHILLAAQQPRRNAGQMAEVVAQEKAARLRRVARLEMDLAAEDVEAAAFGATPSQAQPNSHSLGRATIIDTPAADGEEGSHTNVARKGRTSKAPTPKTPTAASKTPTKSTTSTKKPPQRKAKRVDVDTYRKDLANTENEPVVSAGGKCKSSNTSESANTKAAKKAKPANPSGLLVHWTQPAPNSATITTTGRHTNTSPASIPVMGQPAVKVEAREYGGYVSSDEEEPEEYEIIPGPQSKPPGCAGPRTDRETANGVVAIQCAEQAAMINAECRVVHDQITVEAQGGSGSHGGFRKADLPAVIQEIWDQVYGPEIPYLVTPQGVVFDLAQQKVYEWRSNIAKDAIENVNQFFQVKGPGDMIKAALAKWKLEDTPDGRAAFVATQINSSVLFQYGEVDLKEEEDSTVSATSHRKPFQSYLVLVTLAFHMEATYSAIPFVDAPPRGALALCAVAVERALGMFKTGTFKQSPDKFAEHLWSRVLNFYAVSIGGLMPETWDTIVESAAGLAALSRSRPHEVLDNADDGMDARALIVDNRD
ncbi:hypothetical protein B0H21DRAFT_827380 [Amylocystis lapponica]|nr:hypothetical protein B0H21DRAFT_827380 [Amylocystis lapponica]